MPVHPRACGEHVDDAATSPYYFGSSPRLRGTFCEDENCGISLGSSPRLRGTYLTLSVAIVSSRFIPAPAGNICREQKTSGWNTVHPRACGEHAAASRTADTLIGSSPRLRGTCQPPRQPAGHGRFIPAPAGNMTASSRTSTATTVHPRACGEHNQFGIGIAGNRGSSPRLRGTSNGELDGDVVERFIPAPAGNIESQRRSGHRRAVHPRACGEHTRKSWPVR